MLLNLVYLLGLVAASPWILYRSIRFGRYRRGAGEKFCGLSLRRASAIRDGHGPLVWFHAVSVGEVNLLPSLVAKLRANQPDCRVAISASTDSGFDLAVQRFGSERVFFCPLDFTWSIGRTLKHLRPDLIVLAELEIWPNLIRLAAQRNCPVMVMNARLSESSAAGYRRFKRVTESTFARLTWVGCQDESAAERFRECGVPGERAVVTGSLKFDNAPTSRDQSEVQTRYNWAGIEPWHQVWCFGSTQAGEEELAIRVYKQLCKQHPALRLILAPRHPERFTALAELIAGNQLRVIRRSRNDSQYSDVWESDEVILIDTIGELRHWWGVSQIATVGGSFGNRGGQNMLEPAGYGCAVSFGPDTRNFAEIAGRLLAGEAAIRVHDEQALLAFVSRCLDDPPAAAGLGRAAQAIVIAHRGATERTVTAIQARLPRSEPAAKHRAA